MYDTCNHVNKAVSRGHNAQCVNMLMSTKKPSSDVKVSWSLVQCEHSPDISHRADLGGSHQQTRREAASWTWLESDSSVAGGSIVECWGAMGT